MEPTPEQLVEALRRMWLIRYFEESAMRLYGEGRYRGSTHPYIAQEATALGVCAALRPDDKVLATYRGHGAAIAKGCDPRAMMAELLGRESGLCGGKGGSMHMSQPAIGFIGCNAIVAGHIAIAGGIALADKLDGHDTVTAAFLGDGASCEGVFYETLNMAALWKLPLVLVVENNGLAISTHVSEAISVPDISLRALGFGLPGVTVNGCDFFAVYQATVEAAERARSGAGPTLLEAKTVRWARHSAVARSSGPDFNRWRETDPLPRFRAELLERGLISEAQADDIERQAEAEIKEAEAFALASPYPAVDALHSDVFA